MDLGKILFGGKMSGAKKSLLDSASSTITGYTDSGTITAGSVGNGFGIASSDPLMRQYQHMVDAQKHQFHGNATAGDYWVDPRTGDQMVYNGSAWVRDVNLPHATTTAVSTYYTPEAIAFRLRLSRKELEAKGIEILNVRRVLDEIHVVLGVKDQTLVLKDDEGSFPSDEFVAKMRLLL